MQNLLTVRKTEPYNKHIKVHNSEPKNKSTALQKVPGKTGMLVKKEYRDRKKSHGVTYDLISFDTDLTSEEMMDMAEEIIAAR